MDTPLLTPQQPAREMQGAADAADSEAVLWARVREVYEGDTSVTTRAIIKQYGISKYFLQKHVEQEGWTPRRKRKRGVSRGRIIKRLLEAIDRQLTALETEDIPTERKVTMTATMSRSLQKVLQLEKDRRKGSKKKEASAEMTALREKIAKRIEQLNQG